MAEYIDTSINPADYIEVWEVEDAEHGKQLVMAVDDLKCLPPADVRPVAYGRWEPRDLTFGRSIYECSCCHSGMFVPAVNGKPGYPYCPDCGAIMREDKV